MIAETEPLAQAATVRSTSSNQSEILQWIRQLHCPAGFECDATYGSGQFYTADNQPRLRFDLEPLAEGVSAADARSLPLEPDSIGSLVLDPPFLTYVRAGRTGNGKMRLARRFSGYWTFTELEDAYRDMISEGYRVLAHNGLLVFKCQDIVHNHQLHATHLRVIQMAELEGFRLEDLYCLLANHRMPGPNRLGRQRHARIFHSYFLVFRKRGSQPRHSPFLPPTAHTSTPANKDGHSIVG